MINEQTAPVGPAKAGPKFNWRQLAGAFSPNHAVSSGALKVIALIQVTAVLLIWLNSPWKVLPTPIEVLGAFKNLWMNEGMGQEMLVSFQTNLDALAITSLVSIVLAYATVLPFFRTITNAISRGRFLSLAGFTLIFTLAFGGGHTLKVALLVVSMTFFFVTSMSSVVSEIPKSNFDHARTLRMSEWRVVWEVVILGTASQAFEVLRQNAAIGWMMLTMVEGIARAEGGVGALLLNQQKHFLIAEVFAVQIVILLVGLGQDYALGVIRNLVCPYTRLVLERQ